MANALAPEQPEVVAVKQLTANSQAEREAGAGVLVGAETGIEVATGAGAEAGTEVEP